MAGALSTILALAWLLCSGLSFAAETTSGAGPEDTDRGRAERLRALGYLDYAADAHPADEGSGVTVFDEERAQPGTNLVVSSRECAARLVAMDGEVLHVWRQRECGRWFSAEWLAGGDLIVNGRLRPPSRKRVPPGRFTARVAPDGEVRWLRELKSHHQVDFTPQREVLVMTEALVGHERFEQVGPSVAAELRIHENPLQWLDENGEPLGSLSLFDALIAAETDFVLTEPAAMQEGRAHLGVFHANAARVMDQSKLRGADALHAADNVLVTSRNQDRVFIVSRKQGAVLWQWGKGQLSRPHDGSWLANGNILVFDNGVDRESSRVVEVDPAIGKIVWEYPAERGEPFYSAARGMAQRLSNGNTLIVVSQAGMAFEVAASGEVVWRYYNPPPAGGSRRPALVFLRRYPAEFRVPVAHAKRGAESPG